MKEKDNVVVLSGTIASPFTFSHEIYGEKFYNFYLNVSRLSGKKDTLPVVVSERIINSKANLEGKCATVSGKLRSYNKEIGEKNKLFVYIFADLIRLEETPEKFSENAISLCGYVCKKPIYRETPLGREIADLLLAVNRPYRKSDYIPCICWGRNARFSESFAVGEHIQLWGRIQSREYQKKLSETEFEKRIAYEVSVSKINVIEGTED
uniref:Single strand binding protein n=1 Tax=Dulem virus 39 TaxID=3145757 RepID=A0AAU8B7H6_9CAUD